MTQETVNKISDIFKVLSHPVRLQVLQVIGKGEACVCHLEAQLDIRQATLSQHLMVLREADLLDTRREGRYIFYRLANSDVLDIIQDSANLMGIEFNINETTHNACECPKCCE